MNRRAFLGGVALGSLLPEVAFAGVTEVIRVDSREGQVMLTRYPAKRIGRRPSVALLHGTRGFELKLSAYERYVSALTAEGIDAYLVHFYAAADGEKLKAINRKDREAYDLERYPTWAERVSSVVTAILESKESSGRLGLLGFSLGGFVAAATAARDERVAALAVLYGGMPSNIAPHVEHMPPVIEIHGDADRNVPPATGEALVALSKAVGAPAEQVTYAGKGHGFDFIDSDPATADAVRRVAHFFRTRLAPV